VSATLQCNQQGARPRKLPAGSSALGVDGSRDMNGANQSNYPTRKGQPQ
jgi:hypothetical protein